jgi:hypothetical protein
MALMRFVTFFGSLTLTHPFLLLSFGTDFTLNGGGHNMQTSCWVGTALVLW